jgi:hypothetical protein
MNFIGYYYLLAFCIFFLFSSLFSSSILYYFLYCTIFSNRTFSLTFFINLLILFYCNAYFIFCFVCKFKIFTLIYASCSNSFSILFLTLLRVIAHYLLISDAVFFNSVLYFSYIPFRFLDVYLFRFRFFF